MPAYRLFLDDLRNPPDVARYIMPCGLKSLYQYPAWTIVRNLEDFKKIILEHGMPSFISFDHDLGNAAVASEDATEITGVTAARWLCQFAAENGSNIPPYQVHSVNPVGRENIISVLESYKKVSSQH